MDRASISCLVQFVSEDYRVPSALIYNTTLGTSFGFQAWLAQTAINGSASIDKAFD